MSVGNVCWKNSYLFLIYFIVLLLLLKKSLFVTKQNLNKLMIFTNVKWKMLKKKIFVYLCWIRLNKNYLIFKKKNCNWAQQNKKKTVC